MEMEKPPGLRTVTHCPVRKLHSETEKLRKKNNEISFVRHKYCA